MHYKIFCRGVLAMFFAGILATGCDKGIPVASGPIQLTAAPKEIRFSSPTAGPLRGLCLIFAHSPESHHASGIKAVLLTASGERRPLVNVDLDRRGERIVCLMGATAIQDSSRYHGVELSSKKPVELRQIRWLTGAEK